MLTENDIIWLCVYHSQHRRKDIFGRYTTDIKMSAKEMYRAGMGSSEIQKLLGIPSITITRWLSLKEKKRKHHKFHYKSPIMRQLRNSDKYRIWRDSVYKRDNWTCRQCNIKGGNLHAHHLKSFSKYPKQRFDIDNGITFCVSCHIGKHAKEKVA